MSTNRRRPTGGLRRPQVAGRPRTAGPAGTTDAQDGAESALAVEERTGARPEADSPREHPGRASGAPDAPGTAPDRSGGSTTTRTGGPVTPTVGTPPDDGRGAPDEATDRSAAATAEPVTAEDTSAEDRGTATSDRPEPPRATAVGGIGPGDRERRDRLRRIPTPSAPTTRRGTAVLLVVTLLLAVAAAFFAVSWFGMRYTGAATNTALSDVGTTATVSEQVGEAVTTVYSFDFARLDQAESDARAGITGPFNQQFDQIFGNVRQLAPKQQAVVTATVPKSAVASIEGERATVYLFVNQVIRRVDDTGTPQQGGAAARLRVDAQFVDGRWKIAGMSPA